MPEEPITTSATPVFVIGTGRSGTHWLGYSLENHPDFSLTVEVQPMFGLSTQMALNASLEPLLFGNLISAYRQQLSNTSKRFYLDKSHPNIWIAEKLKEAFPNAFFLGIQRNPYATIASMLNHKGVLSWQRKWREFPIPNRFLGITPEIAERYEQMSLPSQCALRWLAHHNRMQELHEKLGESLLTISYETFARKTEATIQELQRFLCLQNPIQVPYVKTDSLQKWRAQLTEQHILQIQHIVGIEPDL